MTEVYFYHLEQSPLERVLPDLLEKTLERGWKAVVRAGSPERVEALNDQLWAYGRATFLPHGSKPDGEEARQPIWLTEAEENPNGAAILFLVDGADTEAVSGYTRVCDIFDGNDEEALAAARARWKRAKDAGHTMAYFQQDGARWVKKA